MKIMEMYNAKDTRLKTLAKQIFEIAEGEAADRIADEGGHGFHGGAVEQEAEAIFKILKKLVEKEIVKEYK